MIQTATARVITRAMHDVLEAQQTMQHQGIEAYRQTAHAFFELVPREGDRPAPDGVDAHCDGLHDLVDESWTLYDTFVREGMTMAGPFVGTQRPVTVTQASEPDLEEIEGIGASYAARLRELGIESVTDLAHADPSIETEIDAIGVDVTDWIDQARNMVDEGSG